MKKLSGGSTISGQAKYLQEQVKIKAGTITTIVDMNELPKIQSVGDDDRDSQAARHAIVQMVRTIEKKKASIVDTITPEQFGAIQMLAMDTFVDFINSDPMGWLPASSHILVEKKLDAGDCVRRVVSVCLTVTGDSESTLSTDTIYSRFQSSVTTRESGTLLRTAKPSVNAFRGLRRLSRGLGKGASRMRESK